MSCYEITKADILFLIERFKYYDLIYKFSRKPKIRLKPTYKFNNHKIVQLLKLAQSDGQS